MSRSSEVPPGLQSVHRYLRRVRFALLSVLIAFGVGASLTWWFRTPIFLWLLAPARNQISPTWQPIFTGPTEMMGQAIHLAMLGGCTFAFPVLVVNVFRLNRPLLTKPQRRFIILFLPAAGVCYLAGAAFAYFVLLPTGLGFLLQFGTDVATPMLRISEYMALVTALIFWLGVIAELPLLMVGATKLGTVKYQRLKRLRRYVPTMAFIFGAIITPTMDAVNLLLVAVPMIVLYEVGLFGAWLAQLRRPTR